MLQTCAGSSLQICGLWLDHHCCNPVGHCFAFQLHDMPSLGPGFQKASKSKVPGAREKAAPVVIVLGLTTWIFTSYILSFCLPLQEASFSSGTICICVCSFLTLMTVWSYIQAVITHPGTPLAAKWAANGRYPPLRPDAANRKCDVCCVYKPPRTHHCSKCQQCILQYDHHCPWINNCVGFYNKKFFMLFVLYATLDVAFVCATSLDEVLVFQSGLWCGVYGGGANVVGKRCGIGAPRKAGEGGKSPLKVMNICFSCCIGKLQRRVSNHLSANGRCLGSV